MAKSHNLLLGGTRLFWILLESSSSRKEFYRPQNVIQKKQAYTDKFILSRSTFGYDSVVVFLVWSLSS